MDDRIADRWYEAVTVTVARQAASPAPRRAAPPGRAAHALLSVATDGPSDGPPLSAPPLDGSPFGGSLPDQPGPGDAALRAELRTLTGQLLVALVADPVDGDAGRAVGARLARLGFTDSDVLARTVEVLGPPLSAAAGPGRAPAAFAVLGAVMSGHGDAVRARAVAAAEQRHRAELAGLRRAERASRLADRRFRAVFEHAGVGALVVADCGQILEANDTARQIVGRDLSRLSIGDVWDLLHPRDRSEVIDLWAGARAGRPGHGVFRLDRPAGPDAGPVWVSLSAAMVDDDAVADGLFYAVTIEDVTGRPDRRAAGDAADRHDDPARRAGAGHRRRAGAGPDPAGPEPGQETTTARLTRSIASALRAGQFVVHYQPIVRLTDGRIQGAEALVRWDHPRLGLLSPDTFIGPAEESGLIVPLGLHVLETACRDATGWARAAAPGQGTAEPLPPEASSPETAPFVSVNLSARQLEEPDVVPAILDVVDRAGLDRSRLQLELVESLLVNSAGRPAEALRELADAGIRIAIDDFGTGYSNFAYLTSLPARALKLAGQLCGHGDLGEDLVPAETGALTGHAGAGDGVVRPGGGRAEPGALDEMVGGIVSIAHRLGHVVTVEAVETTEQAARMLALGADLGQGHLFGRPMCADKLTAVFTAAATGAGLASPGGGSPRGAIPPVPVARDSRHWQHHAATHCGP
ncbi:EAL domain-containing protein [Frankia sp. CNm7]|uniref:EAL domain-containing protein n=1 Tax=Frankia nepalensis TaxID=1836974 RepID=A0A937RC93_9ACTN|nr:EAL domain-containing protein [Frankia nepalensis]MBL7509736.1 EAL domain-containing protein [Frankia nepalensis]MBL7516916.1 EAL domain-containing protein [Frankia nepalensis]MBL7629463.1 EAL domain-containing protein [Frankia nepalensis]